ncbi:unnamed protein product [Leptidea sinapis]|uniref:Uncharacterized protein n=2 Tax=Leptidea sinapis TaxID=189913 RepID=A0A5E4QMY3_9NEOP|nr:unnamed protein product [Leptidea sinapis]
MENLRRLTRELRAVRACRDDALANRRMLLATRSTLRTKCVTLRTHIINILSQRSDRTEVPDIEPDRIIESPPPCVQANMDRIKSELFECRVEKLVEESVNHMYDKRVCAKTVFLKTECDSEVLNLSVKKRSHGRKQSSPRRITYVFTEPDDDGVLDLKIKKEPV